MVFELGEHGRNFRRVLARFFLWQVEDIRARERREARVDPLRHLRPHKEQGGIILPMTQRIFDRCPRLVDPAEPMQSPSRDGRRLPGARTCEGGVKRPYKTVPPL
jgi:hypothetical protein